MISVPTKEIVILRFSFIQNRAALPCNEPLPLRLPQRLDKSFPTPDTSLCGLRGQEDGGRG